MSASTDLTTIIARVRELDAAATKGPWMAPHARVQAEQVGYVYRAEGMASQVARTMSTTRGMSDAALIAEYRTAAPALADEVERLAALFQQAYGVHHSWVAECERLRERVREHEKRENALHSKGMQFRKERDALKAKLAESERERDAARGEASIHYAVIEQYRSRLALCEKVVEAARKMLVEHDTELQETENEARFTRTEGEEAMTDEEACAAALDRHFDECVLLVARGFAAGLAHARKWRPLTESPASWPESGTRMAIVDAADMTRFRIATRVHAPEQMADFIVNGWTHWLPLPPPPKGTHDH